MIPHKWLLEPPMVNPLAPNDGGSAPPRITSSVGSASVNGEDIYPAKMQGQACLPTLVPPSQTCLATVYAITWSK
jgi:hypothetical protein